MATKAKTKTGRKKSAVSGGPKKTRKFAGKNYTHRGCSSTKVGAKKMAENLRKKGKNARVVKVGNKHCVYSRG